MTGTLRATLPLVTRMFLRGQVGPGLDRHDEALFLAFSYLGHSLSPTYSRTKTQSQQLKRWRQANGLSQAQATRVLNQAGIHFTLDALQAWEIGRWNPRAHIALALAEFLQKQSKRRPRRRPKPPGQ